MLRNYVFLCYYLLVGASFHKGAIRKGALFLGPVQEMLQHSFQKRTGQRCVAPEQIRDPDVLAGPQAIALRARIGVSYCARAACSGELAKEPGHPIKGAF